MSIWIANSVILGIIFGGLGYFHSKAANGLFLLSLLSICFGAVAKLKYTGEIHELSTGVGETAIVEIGRKLGWTFEVFDRMAPDVQTAIFVYIGVFFIARIIAWIASAKRPEKVESEKKRRKRILKSFKMKNMEELRSKF